MNFHENSMNFLSFMIFHVSALALFADDLPYAVARVLWNNVDAVLFAPDS